MMGLNRFFHLANNKLISKKNWVTLHLYPRFLNQNIYSMSRFLSSDKRIPYPIRKKVPPFEECHSPNLMSDRPQPIKGWEEQNSKWRKRNILIFLLGLAIFSASVAGVSLLNLFEKQQKPHKVKKVLKSKKKQLRDVPKNPKSYKDIPEKVPYLLIGGGTASFAAFRAIKSLDPMAKVLVISNEPFNPYMRPPLSKEMWFNQEHDKVEKLIFKQWNGSERSLFYEPDDFYLPCKELLGSEHGGVSVATGYSVVEIDPSCKRVKLDTGNEIGYDKCLLATGAKPKLLPVFEAALNDPEVEDRVKVFRNIYDFEDMAESFDKSQIVAVIGSGFLGSELACGLARIGKEKDKTVYQVFREGGNLGKILPEYLSRWTTDKVMKEGVEVCPNVEVVSCKYDHSDRQLHLGLIDGKTLKVDSVIVAVGVEANTKLSEKAGLEVDSDMGGFLVNAELQARTDLYIAGDCSCFYDPKLGRRRVEHHDHAVVTGRLAGENMTGAAKPYVHQSMFWSDLGPDVGFEAIGLVDSSLPTVGVFVKTEADGSDDENPETCETISVPASCDKPIDKETKKQIELESKTLRKDIPKGACPEDFGKGIVFYLKNDKVVGIVLWNLFNRISVARQVLKEDKKYDDLNEVAKLFHIHEE